MKIDIKDLQRIMDNATESGEECGCQLAIYRNGKLEVSLVSGYTSSERNEKVNEHSLFPIFSCGKGVLSTAVHQLAEQGILDYNARIADYWPQFGCNGKEDIRLWQVMSHRTGLHQLPATDGMEQQADWDLMVSKIEQMKPVWEPGTRCGYQAVTFAWLVGETIRRATGKNPAEIIRDQILKPLHIENDFFFGTIPEVDSRCVHVDNTNDATAWVYQFAENMAIRRGFIPSANGFGNALSLGRHYSALVADTDGVRLLKPETVAQITKLRRWEKDNDMYSNWARFSLGYALPGDKTTLTKWFGHGGALGAEGFADKEEHWAYAFTKNKSLKTHPVHPVRAALSRSLELTERIW